MSKERQILWYLNRQAALRIPDLESYVATNCYAIIYITQSISDAAAFTNSWRALEKIGLTDSLYNSDSFSFLYEKICEIILTP